MTIVTRLGRVILASLFTFAVKTAEPAESGDVKQSFKTAAEKMQAGRFAEAVPLFEKVRAAIPPTLAVEWNLGLAYAALDRPEDALGCWKTLAQLEPGNFQTTAKIVQALQALGRDEERDKAIAQVFSERKQTKNPQLAKIPWFCREQFKVGDRKVMVFPKRPGYAVIREQVVKAMKEEIKAVSSSSVPAAEKK